MKKHLSPIHILTVLALILAMTCSCKSDITDDTYIRVPQVHDGTIIDSVKRVLEDNPDDIGANLALISYFTLTGQISETIALSAKVAGIAERRNDSTIWHIARTYTALAYTMQNKVDSIAPYIRSVEYISEHDTTSAFSIIANNTAAIYAIKEGLYYSKAINYFKRGLRTARNSGNHYNQAVTLCNIADIYLIRKDPSGMKYAREAYKEALLSGASYPIIGSALGLAEMLILDNRYDEALAYTDSALAHCTPGLNDTEICYIYITRAAAKMALNDMQGAESSLLDAGRSIDRAIPDTRVKYYMEYGKFLMLKDEYRKAEEILEETLRMPACRNDIRQEALLILSEACSASGKTDEALNYFKQYHHYYDSLSVTQKERDFNTLLLQFEQSELGKQIADRELVIEKNKKKSGYIIAALTVICITISIILLFYKKRNQMYSNLVGQHQKYLEQKKQMKNDIVRELAGSVEGSKDKELFNRIETLMTEEKAYCNKDISLDKIAESLSSNRVYISKVINKYSGLSFFNYINAKRIEKATAILSDPSDDTPLKVLSDELGYNSISTFYRAFQKETGCPPSKYRAEVRKIHSNNPSQNIK